jgi:hypothetical protein
MLSAICQVILFELNDLSLMYSPGPVYLVMVTAFYLNNL